jgi:hypothetical protein
MPPKKRKVSDVKSDPKKPEFPVLPPSKPTTDELKKHCAVLDEKGLYYLIVHPNAMSSLRFYVYSAVPGELLKPYWLYITGAIHAIEKDREEAYLMHHPTFIESNVGHVSHYSSEVVFDRELCLGPKFYDDCKPFLEKYRYGVIDPPPANQTSVLCMTNWDE